MASPTLLSTNSSSVPGDYYPSLLHEEALARLAYLGEQGTACGLLSGLSGCGKTLVLSRFAQQQRKQGVAVAAVSALQVPARELLLAIGTGLGVAVRSSDEPSQSWSKVCDRLRVLNLEQTSALLLVDDLDQATAEGAAVIDRLQGYADGIAANLVVVVACGSRGQELLSTRLLSRVQLRVELDLWTREECGGFLQQWLAAREPDAEFDDQAIEVLHNLAEGNPRRVRQLAELTLLAGKETGGYLSDEVVEAAFEEMCLRA